MSNITARHTSSLLYSTSLSGVVRNSAMALASLVMASTSSSSASAQTIDPNTLPTGGNVSAGAATFQYDANSSRLDIHQSSQRAVIDWNSFNIGSQAHTNFNQTGTSAVAVNRIHDVNPSQIQGKLSANGQVILLNTNGVIFGENAKVDVGGLLASTGKIDAERFMQDGTINLSNLGAANGIIRNDGSITVHDSGLAAFVAPNIVNNGVIEARLGKIALAAGNDTATVDLYGDGLVELGLDAQSTKAVMIENQGKIIADGGRIAISAKTAKDAVDSVINMDGLVQANSVNVKNGVITLSATNADVKIGGQVHAKGGKGKIDIRTNRNINVAQSAELNASANTHGDGGSIHVIADNNTKFSGAVIARGGSESGNGGFAEISGYQALGFDGYANLGATNGKAGSLLLDPRFAIIHSGAIGGTSGYVISAQALANAMQSTNVTVQADEFIDVGTRQSYPTWVMNLLVGTLLDHQNIDLSTYDYTTLNFSGPIWTWGPVRHTGTTMGSLVLQSDTVNFNRQLKLGNGGLDVQANTVNLNAHIVDKNNAKLAANKITSSASLVNVLSNQAWIQQGIDLAKTGATVNVAAGTYQEQIEIAKNLTLKGAGAGQTTITSPAHLAQTATSPQTARNYSIVYVHDASKVDISGFTVDGSTNAQSPAFTNSDRFIGILYRNAGGTIENNHITNILSAANTSRTGFGILASSDTQANTLNISNNTVDKFQTYGIAFVDKNLKGTIQNNTVIGNKDVQSNLQTGVLVGWSSKATVDGNTIQNVDTGIEVFQAAGNTVKDNTLTNVVDGITVESSNNTQLVHNTIASQAGKGISVNQSNNAKIIQNTITGAKNGIYLANSNGAVIGGSVADTNTINNSVGGWADAAIYAQYSNGLTITHNSIDRSNSHGIFVERQTGNGTVEISDNTLTNINQTGIYLKHWDGAAKINHNTIDRATSSAITLELTKGTSVTKNIVNNAGNGINLRYGNDGVDIKENTISKTKIGVAVAFEGQNNKNVLIEDNTITDNTRAIYVDQAENVKIIDNDIEKTAEQGIHTNQVKNLEIAENTLKNVSWTGIQVEGGQKVDIHDNDLSNVRGHGIAVSGSALASVVKNTLDNIRTSGIVVNGTTNALIDDNTISNIKENNGIQGNNNTGLKVTKNTVTTTKQNGIHLTNSKNLTVEQNTLSGNINAVHVADSENIKIHNNTISNALDTEANRSGNDYTTGIGIMVTDSKGTVDVAGNTITNSTDGIRIRKTNAATLGDVSVRNNTISGSKDKAIILKNSNNILVENNDVKSNKFGIYLDHSANSAIKANKIANNTQGGVYIRGASNNIDIQNNVIHDNGVAQIVLNNGLGHMSGVKVFNNNIKGSKLINNGSKYIVDASGNYWNTTSDTAIAAKMTGTVDYSTYLALAADIDATTNGFQGDFSDLYVTALGGQAGSKGRIQEAVDYLVDASLIGGARHIQLNNGVYNETGIVLNKSLTMDGNAANPNAVTVQGTQNNNALTLAANDLTLRYFTMDGHINGVYTTSALNNIVLHKLNANNNTNAGIYLDGALENINISESNINGIHGIYLNGGIQDITIADNTIDAEGFGIWLKNSADVVLDNNTLNGKTAIATNAVGIRAEKTTDLSITNNTLTNVGGNGIELIDTDMVTVEDNTITHSRGNYGMFIDNLNGSLVFSNNAIVSLVNKTGARFNGGKIDLSGAVNTFDGGATGIIFNGSSVELVNNTFGTTIFNGQTGNYIALENGALYAPTSPTILDARQVNFDGFTPNAFLLSMADYTRLANRLVDYRDNISLGWIYFTYPDVITADFFNLLPQQQIAAISALTPGSLTITGLPYSPSTTFGGNIAASLAAITPAAGGDIAAQMASIAPAAGGDMAAELNDLETSSGSENASCWNQVYNQLGQSSVTFSLDNSPQAMLSANEQTGCSI